MLQKHVSLLIAGYKSRDLAKAVVALEFFCFQLFWGAPLNIHQWYWCSQEGKGVENSDQFSLRRDN